MWLKNRGEEKVDEEVLTVEVVHGHGEDPTKPFVRTSAETRAKEAPTKRSKYRFLA